MDVRESSFVTIQAFMVNELHLSGNELIVYAVIFGFSQDGESWFTGSRGYLAAWCQTSEKSVTNNLKKLLEKGLIEKRTKTIHGCSFNDYRAVNATSLLGKKVPPTGEESSLGRGEESSHHTIEDHNPREQNIEREGTRTQKPKAGFQKPTLEEVAAYCRERKNDIDPQFFIDYQEARGWRLKGGQVMKDWKATIRTWERMEGRFQSQAQVQSKRQAQDIDLSDFAESRKTWTEYIPEEIKR